MTENNKFKEILKDLIFRPIYEVKEFTVTFKHGDEIIDEQTVEHGNNAEPPDPPDLEYHEFDEWDGRYTNVRQDEIVYAQYKGAYEVTFIDNINEEEITTLTFLEGENIVTPDERVEEKIEDNGQGYKFTGEWEGDLEDIDGPRTITAIYEKYYTLRFMDNDEIIEEKEVFEGEDAETPSTNELSPPDITYQFSHWEDIYYYEYEDVISDVQGSMDFTAQYEQIIYYVTFVDQDGVPIYEYDEPQEIVKGDSAIPPSEEDEPTKEGHVFDRWDTEYEQMMGYDHEENIEIGPIFVVAEYTVTFRDFDLSLIEEKFAEYGDSVTPPPEPELEGHEFDYWYGNYENITQDEEVIAVYENSHEVNYYKTFEDEYKDDEKIISLFIPDGEDAPKNKVEERIPEETEAHEFTGEWEGDFENVTEDRELYAIYDLKTYTVKFIDNTGEEEVELEVFYEVPHGDEIAAESVPDEPDPPDENMVFDGWDQDYDEVTSDMEIRPVYTYKEQYSIRFLNYDGGTHRRFYVYEGNDFEEDYPDDPEEEGYEFIEWDDEYIDFTNITEDIVIEPIFERKTYTVTFYNHPDKEEEDILEVFENVEHGEDIEEDDVPDSEPPTTDHEFDYWQGSYKNITDDTDIVAIHTPYYIVTYVEDVDNEIFERVEVAGGTRAPEVSTPTFEKYEFDEWDGDFENVTEQRTIVAEYKIKTYTVRFLNYDGSSIDETWLEHEDVEHDDEVEVPAYEDINDLEDFIYPEENAEFIGWSGIDAEEGEYITVTEDMDIRAEFKVDYTVRFMGLIGGTWIEIYEYEEVPPGTSVVPPDERDDVSVPTMQGYEFVGWDSYDFLNVTEDLEIEAVYEKKTYDVEFRAITDDEYRDGFRPIHNRNTFLIDHQVIEWDDDAVLPDTIEIEGFEYTGERNFTTSDLNGIRNNRTLEEENAFNFIYDIRTFDVIFIYDGDRIQENEDIEYGQSIEPPPYPEPEEGKYFKGWRRQGTENEFISDFDNITEDLVLVAEYDDIEFTVEFFNRVGNSIDYEDFENPQRVKYGESVNQPPPEAYQVTGYEFVEWDTEYDLDNMEVEEHDAYIEIHPIYEIETFVVWFLDYDNTAIEEYPLEVEYGHILDEEYDFPEPPEHPDGADFIEWQNVPSVVTSDVEIRARYEYSFFVEYIENITEEEGEEVFLEQYVYNGEDAPDGDSWIVQRELNRRKNQLEGYSFTGDWVCEDEYFDEPFSEIREDRRIIAIFEPIEPEVIFKDYADENIIEPITIGYGESVDDPSEDEYVDIPTPTDNHVFVGWDRPLDNITEEEYVIRAQYKEEFTVTFYDGDDLDYAEVLYEEVVLEGEDITEEYIPDEPEKDYHSFVAWRDVGTNTLVYNFSNITRNMELIPTYSIYTYTVTFYDRDGETILEDEEVDNPQTVEHGEAATPPNIEREAYEFDGWEVQEYEGDYEEVTEDLTVIATYEPIYYTVKFYDHPDEEEAEVLISEEVKHGEAAEEPDHPTLEDAEFVRWDEDFREVTSELHIHPIFMQDPRDVYFLQEAITEEEYPPGYIDVQTVEYEESAEEPLYKPDHLDRVFYGWDKDFDSITEQPTKIQAIVGENVYTRTHDSTSQWRDKAHIFEKTIAYNNKLELGNPDIMMEEVTVYFKDYDGTLLDEVVVDYMDDAETLITPERDGYDFVGWEPEPTEVTMDMITVAQYEEKNK